MDKKKAEFGSEPVDRARIIVSTTIARDVNAAKWKPAKENVLNLAINSGTDLILFNAG